MHLFCRFTMGLPRVSFSFPFFDLSWLKGNICSKSKARSADNLEEGWTVASCSKGERYFRLPGHTSRIFQQLLKRKPFFPLGSCDRILILMAAEHPNLSKWNVCIFASKLVCLQSSKRHGTQILEGILISTALFSVFLFMICFKPLECTSCYLLINNNKNKCGMLPERYPLGTSLTIFLVLGESFLISYFKELWLLICRTIIYLT